MGTGLTFFGEAGGVVSYLRDKKTKKALLAFAAPYRDLSEEAFREKIPEIIEKLPRNIKYDLKKLW
ncbi:MAG: hypothetical protein OHK0053_33370 [Microscillaceae bacterium]